MKKRHSTVLQNAWSKKKQTPHWKNNSALKNTIHSYEKTAQHHLTKCPRPKNKHSHWKNNSGLKNPINSYEKRHSTVLQNARGQKNKHSHWKNNSGLKKPINSYEKTAQHRLTKCLKPKKQTLSLKKQLWS